MIETPEKRVKYAVTLIRDMSLIDYIANRMQAYKTRTKRHDGLAIIRDTLAAHGAHRFSDLPPMEQLAVVTAIEAEFNRAA